jgi:hypothetical protein
MALAEIRMMISDMKKVDVFQLKHWYQSFALIMYKICFTLILHLNIILNE